MIAFNNVIFKNKLFGKDEKYSSTFETGLHEITDKKLYNFLSFKTPYIIEGEFAINDEVISFEEESQTSFFAININSTSGVLCACFKVSSDKKKDKLIRIREQLVGLRELVPTSIEEHKDKIIKILSIIKDEEVIYVLINGDDKTNKEKLSIIKECLDDDLLVFIYNDPSLITNKPKPILVKKEEVVEATLQDNEDLTITTIINENDLKNTKTFYIYDDGFLSFKKEDNSGLSFISFLKNNIKSFLFVFLPVLCLTATSLFLPFYFAKENYLVGAFLLIGFSISTVLYFMFEYSIFDFLRHDNDVDHKRKLIFSIIGHYLFSIFGLGIGVSLFYLMTFVNKSFDKADISINLFILSFICALIVALTPFIIIGARKIIKLILSKKQKNH